MTERHTSLAIGCGLTGMILASCPALALEGGQSVYPMGAETYLVGAIPPPGWYLLNYTEFYGADRFNGANGDKLFGHFQLRAFVEAPRIVKSFSVRILGATPFVAALIPVLDEHVRLDGAHGGTSGIFEADLSQGLGWHLSPSLHVAAGVDEFLPTGNYSPRDLASASLNRYAIEPVVAFTYVDPAGPEFDIKAMYDFNLENRTTLYKSGQDFHFDYALGWNLGPWTIGAGGYFERQMTNDIAGGSPVNGDGFRIAGFAIGPDIQYKLGHSLLRAKIQHEFIADNKPQGNAIWLSWVFPL